MGLGCGTTLVKYILFFFNFLIVLGGIGLVALGIVALVQTGDLGEKVFQDGNGAWASIALIIFGAVVFLIAFMGCCGAIRESHCMTMTYASVLLILIIGQTVIAVLVFVNRHDFMAEIRKGIEKLFRESSPNDQTIANIQQSLRCCGYDGPSFWKLSYPSSCCEGSPAVCTSPFQDGCGDRIQELVDTFSVAIGWVAIGVAVVELVALVFACCLGNNIRNAERRYA